MHSLYVVHVYVVHVAILGKSPVGFINPVLYGTGGTVGTDITTGCNKKRLCKVSCARLLSDVPPHLPGSHDAPPHLTLPRPTGTYALTTPHSAAPISTLEPFSTACIRHPTRLSGLET